ncbi:MAG: ParB/RepB/Spo0J family partition protein [Patescibacteria group bacterium]|nr:ParB/RepB/Spo0J family partition protein [Patescibacteria group bacterium]
MAHRGLGRGLSSLIPKIASPKVVPPSSPVAVPADQIHRVPPESIAPNPEQPRKDFDHEGLEDLIASIKQYGILQPLVATRAGGGFQLIAGERRLRAAKILQLETVPVLVRDVKRQQQLELSLIENIQRQSLNPIEEATAYQRLISEFNCTQENLAERVGKSRSLITNTLRLLTLPEDIQQAVVAGKITAGAARVIAGVPEDNQGKLFRRALRENWTVRALEAAARVVTVRRHRRHGVDPQALAYQGQLEQALGTKVRVKKTGPTGRIEVDFFSDEDLAGLVEKICRNG